MSDNRDTSPSTATRAAARVALVTCAELPDLDQDDRALIPALAARGITAEPVAWDAPGVDWAAYDLAVIRNTWDYPKRRAEFTAWARSVPGLANPAAVIEWNTDKRYLRELAAAGIPIVPTTWVEPGDAFVPEGTGEIVVKPAISAGSIDTGRYDLATQAQLVAKEVRRLQDAGRLVMIQPYLEAVDTAGETALLFFAGEFSHAIRKGAILTGPYVEGDLLYQNENISPRTPSAAEQALAARVLEALPVPAADLLYTRIDLLPSPDGPVVIEVELAEPSLFFGYAPGSADRFAAAVERRLT
ncbi:RimK family alpha-L-glutamate ligase [Dactylosporangium sp. NPDC051541]|uniref:RimK family alpha-L-glutamate ligase n=1 Tax=Dactylosporangium sp. NPDC051541 TaxID=3363977 RepID=UPI0037996F08